MIYHQLILLQKQSWSTFGVFYFIYLYVILGTRSRYPISFTPETTLSSLLGMFDMHYVLGQTRDIIKARD